MTSAGTATEWSSASERLVWRHIRSFWVGRLRKKLTHTHTHTHTQLLDSTTTATELNSTIQKIVAGLSLVISGHLSDHCVFVHHFIYPTPHLLSQHFPIPLFIYLHPSSHTPSLFSHLKRITMFRSCVSWLVMRKWCWW